MVDVALHPEIDFVVVGGLGSAIKRQPEYGRR